MTPFRDASVLKHAEALKHGYLPDQRQSNETTFPKTALDKSIACRAQARKSNDGAIRWWEIDGKGAEHF
jgi:hypothetical protein